MVHPSKEAKRQEARPIKGGPASPDCITGLLTFCLLNIQHRPGESWPPPHSWCSRAERQKGCRRLRGGEGSLWASFFRPTRSQKGCESIPWALHRVISTCSAPARCHLFPIQAELERVVTLRREITLPTNIKTFNFILSLSLTHWLTKWTLKLLTFSIMPQPQGKYNGTRPPLMPILYLKEGRPHCTCTRAKPKKEI